MDAHWIEFVGRQDPGKTPPPAAVVVKPLRARHPWLREVAVSALAVLALAGLRWTSGHTSILATALPRQDVYATAHVRDLKYALELYARENGHYPARLEELVDDRWVAPDQARLDGYLVLYRPDAGGQRYHLALKPDR
jgi:hypothetical protein